MVVYNGYLGTVDKRSDLDNNHKAYEQFVYALDKANMMKGKVPEGDDKNDVRGICATGYVYEYEVLNGSNQVKRLWTSTCDGSKGSLQASVGQLNNLFHRQIPDFEKIYPFRVLDAQLRL
jgi:outer membrane protein assembly factor BamB